MHTFSVPITKEVKRIGKRRKNLTLKIISYELKFIASARFMTRSLSNFGEKNRK